MKHFFFPYEKSYSEGNLEFLLGKCDPDQFEKAEEETLKAYYDMADIIHDKRFEKEDGELKEFLSKYDKEVPPDSSVKAVGSVRKGQFRIKVLKVMWDYIEEKYRIFDADNGMGSYNASLPEEQQEKMKRTLYHLVRGNLCLRISQCYYEDFDLNNSDIWINRAIEILWHGKNLVADLRDVASSQEIKTQADLYFLLIKLNLAKYYRDYARKNRRSDFDAALDECRQVRSQVEAEYQQIMEPGQKRQYALIWMESIINAVKIHRRKYQVNVAEKEMIFLYFCLRDRVQAKESESGDTGRRKFDNSAFIELIKKTDKLISAKYNGTEESIGIINDLCQDSDIQKNLPGITYEAFEKYNDLWDYDKKRYFLLVLLSLARIRRNQHYEENYLSAIKLAIIADQWSLETDRRERYIPGHNIDAVITISSSLRKYIKFRNSVNGEREFLQKINEVICQFEIRRAGSKETEFVKADLVEFVKKMQEFAQMGHLKSKAEVIKWHCLYLQEPEILCSIEPIVGRYSGIKDYFKKKNLNIQLRFLRGLVSVRSGNYTEAIEIFEDLLERNQNETQYIRLGTIGLKARYLLANCYMSLAEFTRAEKILKDLHDTLEYAYRSRKTQGVGGSTDANRDPRIEIDLGYCYMQRGAYEDAIKIYEDMYGCSETFEPENGSQFNMMQVNLSRRIMGLNNYAACCILSINDQAVPDSHTEEAVEAERKIRSKIETARKIFLAMDTYCAELKDEKDIAWYEWNPETNLLKGFYTLCTGKVPDKAPITQQQIEACWHISTPEYSNLRNKSLLLAHPYFRRACRFRDAFTSRYSLLDENENGNKAKYRNEVERISAYIVNLTKLYKLYLSNKDRIREVRTEQRKAPDRKEEEIYLNDQLQVTNRQLEYLEMSRHNLERFLLNFSSNYKISLKAAIALAEWLLELEESEAGEEVRHLQDQLYRSFSYVTIYEERGAQVFNILRNNREFRFFTAVQRGRFYALLLAMYKPIKAIKEECCFNLADRKVTPHLVHYTSLETLKKILAETSEDISAAAKEDKGPHFRINNCGYMNDVFEGNTFFKCIALIAGENSAYSEYVRKYFPQINRSHEDMLPSGSNVYIGSLSVKEDSFPMWSIYAENESGCNIEFGEDFFNIDGIPYYPRALRNYMLSKYTDKDYPLYIVQYIGSKFEEEYKKQQESDESQADDFEILDASGYRQHCGTESVRYRDLFRLFRQIDKRWMQLEAYLQQCSDEAPEKAVSDSVDAIRAFAADRINEIRFLFKNADYEFEGEVRVVYTDSTDHSVAQTDSALKVPRVYVNLDRKLENLTIRLGSRIEDTIVDKYVTWLKHTKRVKKVGLAKQNRYTK